MKSPTRKFIQDCMQDLASRYVKSGMRVLDIGTAGNLKGENDVWFGTPASYETLDKLKEYNPDYVADISKRTDIKESTFDIIICSQVIEHIPPQYALSTAIEMRRILKPGGLLILDSPGQAVPYQD